MPGDTTHRIECFLVVDFTLQHVGAHIGKAQASVSGVALGLCRCHLRRHEAFLQRIVECLRQTEGGVDFLFHVLVETPARDAFNKDDDFGVLMIIIRRLDCTVAISDPLE